MSGHIHSWEPIQGEAGRYWCLHCPKTGYRAASGWIREHKGKLARSPKVNARPYLESGGRIPPKPTSRG